MAYAWLQYAAARQQLAARLADPGNVFWSDAECGIYICQALRIFNSLTFTWKTDYIFNSPNLWNSLGLLSTSPRLRTLTDTYAYTEMEYMLLEPPTGNTWTGTTQFNISNLAQALGSCRDEIVKVSNCNTSLLKQIPITPGTRRTNLPDTVIDVARVRYQAIQATVVANAVLGSNILTVASTTGIAKGQIAIGAGIVYGTVVQSVGSNSVVLSQPTNAIVAGLVQFFACTTLYRDDTVAQEFYEPPLWQLQESTPYTFQLTAEPPLAFDVDYPPTLPGYYEAIVSNSADPLDPTTGPTLMGIPDDYVWVAEWGALAEVLGRESEATDTERAAYAQKMYLQGLNLLLKTPWIMLGKVNQQAVTVDAFADSDRYSPEWDSNPSEFGPFVSIGGIDFMAAPVGSGIGVTVLANAPIPTTDTSFVQVSRDNWNTVLDLAQARAMFKQGGAEFQQGQEIESRAILACAAENSRLMSTGSFADILVQRGQAQDRVQERYMSAPQEKS